jgi:hypothetical protein
MPPPRRALPLLALVPLLLGACVSLEEAPMARQALTRDQRLLLLVYSAPGPVLSEEDSKAETAAKIVPGLGLVVKDSQDQRDLKASKDLQQYLPPFDASQEFDGSFRKQLLALGTPSRVISEQDTGLPADTFRRLNAASDELDWQLKYYVQQPGAVGVSRNYSRFLGLDDVVVLEVNLVYGLDSEDEQVYAPTLKAVTKLVRANTMHQLWRHENIVSEPNAKKTLYEFKTSPNDLLFAWKRLMPALGLQIADDLRKNLGAAGVSLDPRAGLEGPGAPGLVPLSGAGWAPAPIASEPPAVVTPVSASGAAFTPRPSTP